MFYRNAKNVGTNKKGLTLIETMLALAILGIIATLATASYATYVKNTKEQEAKIALKRFGDLSTTYFYSTHYEDVKLASNGTVPALIGADYSSRSRVFPVDNTCSAGAVPDTKTSAAATDWSKGVWGDLGFRMEGAHYYQYCYQAAAGGESYQLVAQARLNGDGIDSRFVLFGSRNGHDPEIRMVELDQGDTLPGGLAGGEPYAGPEPAGNGNNGNGNGNGNNGHGNNADGVDSSNPGKSKEGMDSDPTVDDETSGGQESAPNTSNDSGKKDKKNKGNGHDNNGHGNNIDGVDSSNPGKSKEGMDSDPTVDDEAGTSGKGGKGKGKKK